MEEACRELPLGSLISVRDLQFKGVDEMTDDLMDGRKLVANLWEETKVSPMKGVNLGHMTEAENR